MRSKTPKAGLWRALRRRPWLLACVFGAVLQAPLASAAEPSPPPSDKDWSQLMDALQKAGDRIDSRLPPGVTDQDLAENTLVKLGVLMSGYLTIAQSNPDYPRFVPSLGLFTDYLGPNPDTVYFATAISGDGVYRIRGTRGTVPIVNFGVLAGTYMGLTGKPVPHVDYDIDKLKIGPDGSFEVILSAERPAGYAGDWWPMDRRAQRMTVRVVSDDWGKQIDPRLSIQRLDRPSRMPRRPAADIREKVALIPPYMYYTNTFFYDRLAGFVEKGMTNKVVEVPLVEIGGLEGQRYFHGPLAIEPGEALILETEVPKTCKYWSILVTDWLDSTLDWVNNQTSLNRHQARIDRDGKLRVVFANADPGVPNWIDLVGRSRAGMQLRWTGCDSAPIPTIRKAPLASVRAYLPADTPAVSPAEREETLRLRREGAQLRRQW